MAGPEKMDMQAQHILAVYNSQGKNSVNCALAIQLCGSARLHMHEIVHKEHGWWLTIGKWPTRQEIPFCAH